MGTSLTAKTCHLRQKHFKYLGYIADGFYIVIAMSSVREMESAVESCRNDVWRAPRAVQTLPLHSVFMMLQSFDRMVLFHHEKHLLYTLLSEDRISPLNALDKGALQFYEGDAYGAHTTSIIISHLLAEVGCLVTQVFEERGFIQFHEHCTICTKSSDTILALTAVNQELFPNPTKYSSFMLRKRRHGYTFSCKCNHCNAKYSFCFSVSNGESV